MSPTLRNWRNWNWRFGVNYEEYNTLESVFVGIVFAKHYPLLQRRTQEITIFILFYARRGLFFEPPHFSVRDATPGTGTM